MHVVARNWRFRYPAQQHWALDGIDIATTPGEVTWLAGATGSGTSTLLLSLAGLAPRITGGESSGSITHDDAPFESRSPLALGIAYLGPSPAMQLSGIAPSVRDEIAIGPMNLGKERAAIAHDVDQAIATFALERLARHHPGRLSGGETQQVLLASLFASRPALWLLDEPFSALDREAAERVGAILRDVARDGATVIIACDDADVVRRVADTVVLLEKGHVVGEGPPSAVLAGDLLPATGAATTDAATVAAMIGLAPPRPIETPALIRALSPITPVTTVPPAAVPPPAPPSLRFDQVWFAYPGAEPVLRGLDLAARPGEAVGIFGANGAGKSTLLRLAMALEHPSRGGVITHGIPTEGLAPEDLAPAVGFLFQQAERQLFASSVRAECSWAPRLAGWNDDRIRQGVADTLELLGLSDTAEEHPYDLPLPTRKLVALAAIVAADPALLLLDEPTAALDAASRRRVVALVRRWVESGRTVVAITHDALFAHEAMDRGIWMERGAVTLDGTLREILDDTALARPAALALAVELGLPPGRDRRADVVQWLRR